MLLMENNAPHISLSAVHFCKKYSSHIVTRFWMWHSCMAVSVSISSSLQFLSSCLAVIQLTLEMFPSLSLTSVPGSCTVGIPVLSTEQPKELARGNQDSATSLNIKIPCAKSSAEFDSKCRGIKQCVLCHLCALRQVTVQGVHGETLRENQSALRSGLCEL